MGHIPVMTKEVMTYLQIKKGGRYVDSTLDGGGHAREILKIAGSRAIVLGIEQDHEIVKSIRQKNIERLIVEEGNYIHMKDYVQKHKISDIDGILFDFGVSSWHLDESGRGFSFKNNEPLDMRFSQKEGTKSAAELINSLTKTQLANIFKNYGQESRANLVAEAIVSARRKRRIMTSGQLIKIIEKVIPRGKKHPATKIFQALRIAVNRELDMIRKGLEAAMQMVTPGGRVVAISFHSLEDKIVKEMFRSRGAVITKKPIIPCLEEIFSNPRSRSAKLRAWENS